MGIKQQWQEYKGYHKPCQLLRYPPIEKQWADQRASYDS